MDGTSLQPGLTAATFTAETLERGETSHELLRRTEELVPRLIYVGDVPVESSYHGSALLYRLLQDYAAAGLRIVETGSRSAVQRRLSNVDYRWIPLVKSRWMNTRLHPYVVAFYSIASIRMSRQVIATLKDAQFDSVLTVVHGFGWLVAARLAESRGVPLHLIMHDDWPRVAQVPAAFRPWLDQRFAAVYRQAQSRMCISPSMRDEYQRRYGKDGEVLYPMTDRRCPGFDARRLRSSRNHQTFTVAFAGTINTQGYVEALKTLHAVLVRMRGRLLLFGPLSRFEAEELGLDLPNIVLCGFLDWPELIERLREEADALFVPMSFSKSDRANMEMAFPSKLADYTAVGAPLLIYGPQYCSAVRWADENPGSSEVARVEGEEALAAALHRLASSPQHREMLGMRALEMGRRYFSYDRIQSVFDRAVTVHTTQGQTVYCPPT
jgi:glycosyltransferase involved in cell wall biosynthesis